MILTWSQQLSLIVLLILTSPHWLLCDFFLCVLEDEGSAGEAGTEEEEEQQEGEEQGRSVYWGEAGEMRTKL